MAPLPARLLVWEALSDLYVDNELTDDHINSLRKLIEASGYSVADIRQINDNEIAPVLLGNLLGSTGIWTGFDQKWLQQTISHRRPVVKRLLGSRRLWRRWVDYFVGDDLNRLLNLSGRGADEPTNFPKE